MIMNFTCFLCILIIPLISSVSTANLYPSEGPFLQIQSSQQFNADVYKKQKSFFVEFYSSEDQNSIAFAPIWKKTVQNTAAWNKVVQLVSVDCELDANADLCKENNLNIYPTLKYFKYQTVNAKDSQLYSGIKTKSKDLESAIARFVLADYENQKPSEWPDFNLAHDNKPGENLWHHHTHYLALIFETYPKEKAIDSMPMVGVQVILDFSNDPNVLVRRGTSKHQLALANDVKQFPGLLMFSRSHEGSPVYSSRESLTREEVTAKMRRYMNVDNDENGHFVREDL